MQATHYFELFDLPISLRPDQQQVKQRFYALSRQYHPDLFGNADADEQAAALEQSATVNKAFKVLTNADETLKYVLQLKGLLEDEEKYNLPADFLMEMMELSEAAMEGDRTTIASQVNAIQHEIYAPVQEIIEHYEEGTTSPEALLQVKEYYYKKKYLNRILAGLAG